MIPASVTHVACGFDPQSRRMRFQKGNSLGVLVQFSRSMHSAETTKDRAKAGQALFFFFFFFKSELPVSTLTQRLEEGLVTARGILYRPRALLLYVSHCDVKTHHLLLL